MSRDLPVCLRSPDTWQRARSCRITGLFHFDRSCRTFPNKCLILDKQTRAFHAEASSISKALACFNERLAVQICPAIQADLCRFYPACGEKGARVQAAFTSRIFDFRHDFRGIIFLEMDGGLNDAFHGRQALYLVRGSENRVFEE